MEQSCAGGKRQAGFVNAGVLQQCVQLFGGLLASSSPVFPLKDQTVQFTDWAPRLRKHWDGRRHFQPCFN